MAIPVLCLSVSTAGAPRPALAAEALNFCEWTGVWAPTDALGARRHGQTATTLGDGRLLIVGGYDGVNTTALVELYDPATGTFAMTGSLATDRTAHVAILLGNGRVLVAGGIRIANGAMVARLSSAELYDPATGTFSPVSGMGTDRQNAAAALLASGRVLVTGGFGHVIGTGFSNWLATSEVFDPATGAFSPSGPMAIGRGVHQMTRLSTGKVLVSGGYDGYGAIASGELFDPNAGSFSTTGAMAAARMYHTATLLPNGGVLLAGGSNSNGDLATTETYYTASNNFSLSAPMVTARSAHTATLLPSGTLVIAGGENSTGALGTAEMLRSDGFGFTALPTMPAARAFHSASLLQNGNIVLVGGRSGGVSLDSALLYDPLFSATGSMANARSAHTATRLESGQVLIVGGQSTGPGLPPLAGAELYNPSSGTFSMTGGLSTARHLHSATAVIGGRVLVAGGLSGFNAGTLASAELYDLLTGTFSAAGSMTTARYRHTATRLPNGKILIAGGANAGTPTASAELYDPNTNTFSPTGTMHRDRVDHTATLLSNGTVLITGGYSNTAGGIAFSTEVYDPATGTFAQPPNIQWLWTNRTQHAATLLADGRVLITGGYTSGWTPTRKAELYDPNSGYFSPAGDMSTPRASHAATETAMPGNTVLVAGGSGTSASLDSVEIYDPSSGAFSSIGSMQRDRFKLTATVLLDSRVLVTGGTNAFGGTASAEVSKPTHCGPTITLMTPASGPVGTPVTLEGAQFAGSQGASTITFNGTTAGVGSWSGVRVGTSVPLGATTGPVVVTVNGRSSNPVTFTVTAPPAPDLVETSISDPPPSIAVGGGFAITDRVSNVGAGPAGRSTTRYYLSFDTLLDRRDVLLMGTRSVASLPAKSKPVIDTVKVAVPASTWPGVYFVLGCVDDLDVLAESDERNNCRATQLQVKVTP